MEATRLDAMPKEMHGAQTGVIRSDPREIRMEAIRIDQSPNDHEMRGAQIGAVRIDPMTEEIRGTRLERIRIERVPSNRDVH